MHSRKNTYYKYLFAIAAIWNIAFALGSLFLTRLFLEMFGLQTPTSLLWLQLFFALVLVLGLGFYWVSRDLNNNRAIVVMGIVGKSLVFSIFACHWMVGGIPTLVALAGAGDLLFAALFLEFIFKYKA